MRFASEYLSTCDFFGVDMRFALVWASILTILLALFLLFPKSSKIPITNINFGIVLHHIWYHSKDSSSLTPKLKKYPYSSSIFVFIFFDWKTLPSATDDVDIFFTIINRRLHSHHHQFSTSSPLSSIDSPWIEPLTMLSSSVDVANSDLVPTWVRRPFLSRDLSLSTIFT